MERGKYAPKATTPPGSAGPAYGTAPLAPARQPPPAPEPKPGTPGVVRVHIDSPKPVRLVEYGAGSMASLGGGTLTIEQMRPVCAGTCDHIIDGSRGQTFTVMGDFPMSPRFSLSSYQGDLSLRVNPGSTGRRGGGIALMSVGGAGIVLGAAVLAIFASSPGDARGRVSLGFSPGRTGAFIGMMAGGVAALAGGIAVLVTSGTKVEVRSSEPTPGKTAATRPRYWLGEF